METKYGALVLLALIVVILIGILASGLTSEARIESNNAELKSNATINKFKGLCYGPHRDNEDPNFGIQPTISELSEDIAFIQNLTSAIRTYGVTDNLEQIPLLSQQYGIDCYPGAWISRLECENERQIDSLIHIANLKLSHIKGLIVGSEVLLRNDIPEQKLIEFITKVKNSTNLPVATAEIWFDWLEHPQLAEAVDILFVHIYAYWDGVAVEEGANYVLEKWNQLRARYPDKTIVIGETGWPSQGEIRGNAIPSKENQKRYLSDFIAMAASNNIDYFYFEIFDEKWKGKGEGDVGSHWGLYYSNGSIKPLLKDLVPEQAQEGVNRPAREVKATEATLPLYVYSDGCDPQNSFYASGWMGELASYGENDSTFKDPTEILDQLSTENPYSGETCIRISYTPSPGKWGGIYWQFPVNNWGKYPGYDLSKSVDENTIVKLKFWVRGEKGGEKTEFKTGGINDRTLPYKDSYGPLSTGVKILSTAWEADSLMLTGHDLSMVIGGFVWVTNYAQNPQGSTIYLDEILFEAVTPTAVDDGKHTVPTKLFLTQNYPNPFNSSTTISYELEENAEIDISIYNIAGQKVVTLINKSQLAGTHNVKWSGHDGNGQLVSNGIYIYRLTVNKTLIDSRKMILLK